MRTFTISCAELSSSNVFMLPKESLIKFFLINFMTSKLMYITHLYVLLSESSRSGENVDDDSTALAKCGCVRREPDQPDRKKSVISS